MADDTEILVTELRARMGQYERQLAQAANKTDAALNKIERKFAGTNRTLQRGLGRGRLSQELDNLAGRAPVVGGALQGLGAAGLVAAAGVTAAAFAVSRAMEAMTFGDELQAQADKLRISAEALQGLQFAAEETEVPLDALTKGIGNLDARLGAFRTGFGDAKIKGAFELLGISKESLADITEASQLLPILADKISEVQSTADQTRIAKALGVEELLPLLRRGSEGIEEMTQRARDLGLVLSNETVKALADADRQMEIATRQIQSNLRGAFAGLATDIATATTALAQFVNWMGNLEQNAPGLKAALDLIASGMPGEAGIRQGRRMQARARAVQDQGMAIGQSWLDKVTALVDARPSPGPSLSPGGSRGRSGPSAEDEARKRREQARRIADMFSALDMEEMAARAEAAKTAEQRYLIADERLEAEQAAYELELDRLVEDKELSRVQADALLLSRQAGVRQRELNILAERDAAVEEARADAARQALDTEADLLRMMADLATTSAERRQIELRLLDIAYQEEEARLRGLLAAEGIEEAQRAQYQAQLNALGAKKGLAAEGVRRGTAGPLEQFNRDLEVTTDTMQEMAVRGLESLNNGLVDAIVNAKDLGDVARDVFRQIAADLVNTLVRQNITQPATNWLSSALKLFSSAAGGQPMPDLLFDGKFAGGGRPRTGRVSLVGEGGPEAFVPDMPGTILSNPTLRAIQSLNPGALGGGRGGSSDLVVVRVDSSPYFDVEVQRAARPAILQGDAATLRAAHAILPREASRRGSQRLGRGR